MIHQVSSSVLQSSRKHKGPTTSYLSKLVDNNQCFNNWGGKKSLGTWSCVLNTHLQHQSSQNCSVQQRRNLNRSQNDLQMRTWCYTRPCGAETEYWDCNQDEFLHKWTSNTLQRLHFDVTDLFCLINISGLCLMSTCLASFISWFHCWFWCIYSNVQL